MMMLSWDCALSYSHVLSLSVRYEQCVLFEHFSYHCKYWCQIGVILVPVR